jgi:hypothetical protein
MGTRTLPVPVVGQQIDHVFSFLGLAGDKIPTHGVGGLD